MTILEAGLLRSVQGIYDKNDGRIDKEHLEDLIEEFNNLYQGGDLAFTLRGMLLYDELSRPDFLTLKKTVAKDLRIQAAPVNNRPPPTQNYGNGGYGARQQQQQQPVRQSYGQDNFMNYDSNQGGNYGRGGGGYQQQNTGGGNILTRGFGGGGGGYKY